jgi:hypothetical protein
VVVVVVLVLALALVVAELHFAMRVQCGGGSSGIATASSSIVWFDLKNS